MQTKTPPDFVLSLDFSQFHHHAQTIHPSWPESCMDRQMELQELTRVREEKKNSWQTNTRQFFPERVSWKEKAKVNTIPQAFSIAQNSSWRAVVSPIWAKCTKCTNLTVYKVGWQLVLLQLGSLLLVIYAPLQDPWEKKVFLSPFRKNRHKYQQCWG